MNTDHSIKIYTTESIINIDDYKKAESQCKLAGYIKDYKSEHLEGYWIVPNESKDCSIVIHYNTNSKIEFICSFSICIRAWTIYKNRDR